MPLESIPDSGVLIIPSHEDRGVSCDERSGRTTPVHEDHKVFFSMAMRIRLFCTAGKEAHFLAEGVRCECLYDLCAYGENQGDLPVIHKAGHVDILVLM